MQWLYLLIGQFAARLVLFGAFVIVALAVLGWYTRRPIKHYPQRHICGICRVPWYEGHVCAPPVIGSAPQVLITRPHKALGPRRRQ